MLLSRGGGSSTGREAAWDRWTCPAPPPTTASLIKNRSAATIDVFSRVGATESGGGEGGGGSGRGHFPCLKGTVEFRDASRSGVAFFFLLSSR